MAQPAANPKIEELRARVKADPKSRLFYPLAEELRKVGQLTEAEDVLVTGLAGNPTYLSAWVSLGRVLKDLKKSAGAIEALNKALTFDRENIVAAKLLAQVYLDAGNKLEAIKKFKLVHALLPTDLEVEAQINQLDRDLNPPSVTPVSVAEAEPEELHADERMESAGAEVPEEASDTAAALSTPNASSAFPEQPPSPFMPSDEEHLWQEDVDRSGNLPESVATAPPAGETVPEAAPFSDEEGASPFEEESPAPAVAAADDLTATVTMGDLYAQQGHYDSARETYTKFLASHPDASDVRAKLEALPAGATADHVTRRDVVVRKLQDWLSKVGRREAVGRL